MYNSYPNQTSSAAKWIFFGIFGVILLGFLLGANLKNATWLNSDIAAAQANRIQIENAHQQATYELQERLSAAQTEAEIKQIQRQQSLLDAQYAHDIQALNQDLAHKDFAFKTRMTMLTIFAGAFALTLFISATVWVSSKAWISIQTALRKEDVMAKITPRVEKRIPDVPEREPYDPWNSPAFRYQKRVAAQEKERTEREEMQALAARMKALTDPAQMSTGEYFKRPLAGD